MAPSLRCRESGARMPSSGTPSQKLAGPRSGAGFHREAGWSPGPEVRGELRFWDSMANPPELACRGRRRRLRQRLVLLLRPRNVISHDRHDRYSAEADEDLDEQRTRTQR